MENMIKLLAINGSYRANSVDPKTDGQSNGDHFLCQGNYPGENVSLDRQ